MKPKQFFAAICISMPIPTADLPGRQLPGNGGLAVYCIDRGRYVCVVGLLFHKRSAVIGHAHEVKDRHTR